MQDAFGQSFDGVGMKDALTHLALQFWKPTKDGGLAYAGRSSEINDAVVAGLRNWGRTNGVRVLLCVYNAVSGSWDWSLARAGFLENRDKFIEALLAEVERLQLDGADIDLEGNGSLDADKKAFVDFIRRLSKRLHASGKHLTVDTFSYQWNAPNQTWWRDLLPHVGRPHHHGLRRTWRQRCPVAQLCRTEPPQPNMPRNS
jgi:hypothetical protein